MGVLLCLGIRQRTSWPKKILVTQGGTGNNAGKNLDGAVRELRPQCGCKGEMCVLHLLAKAQSLIAQKGVQYFSFPLLLCKELG